MFRTSFYLFISLLIPCSMASAQMIVAHRGASFDAPENTLAAFRLAWEQQADGVEGDFYVTKDQQIACIHDANTQRTGGKKLIVKDATLAELRELEYGAWKDPMFKGEPIPTFAEVMASIPHNKRFIIELKTGPEIVPLLKAELERLKPKDENLLIIAFDRDTVAACKTALPKIRAHWLTSFKQDKATGAWHPTAQELLSSYQMSKADGVGMQGKREVVTSEFIDTLKAGGLHEFHVWTIDEPADAKFFQQLGAVGITTNRPGYIREALGLSMSPSRLREGRTR